MKDYEYEKVDEPNKWSNIVGRLYEYGMYALFGVAAGLVLHMVLKVVL